MTEDNRIPEPLTRDAVLARVIEEANEQVDDDWTTAGTLAFREYFGERLATRLAEAGLLADPAQTAELEELLGIKGGDNIIHAVRDVLQRSHQIEAQRDAAESNAEEACGELADRQQFLTDAVAERDERQARLDRIRVALDYPTSAPWILDQVRLVVDATAPLSGEALRDVEERADAAGDLP